MTQDNDKPTQPEDLEDPRVEAEEAPADEDASDEGKAREKKPSPERKERVLHTRVPAVLESELKRLASSLRMPVSNVVRAILEDAVTAVDLVGRKAEGEMKSVVNRLSVQRERLRNIATAAAPSVAGAVDDAGEGVARADEVTAGERVEDESEVLGGILGFQPLVLAAAATCALCGTSLAAGQQAYLGVREGAGPRVLIGGECLPTHSTDDKEIES